MKWRINLVLLLLGTLLFWADFSPKDTAANVIVKVNVSAKTTMQFNGDGTVTVFSNVPYKLVVQHKVIKGKPGIYIYTLNNQQVTLLTD